MTKNIEVIKDFYNGIENKTRNLFSEIDYDGKLVLFSFGRHFPLAIRLGDSKFITNYKGYSISTQKHKHYLNKVIPKSEQIVLLDCREDRCLEQLKIDKLRIKFAKDQLKHSRCERSKIRWNREIENNKLNIKQLQPFIRKKNLEKL